MRQKKHIYWNTLLASLLWAALAATLGATLAACSKNDITPNNLPYITFGVSQVEANTKGLITNDLLKADTHPMVHVYGVRNNTINLFNGSLIHKEVGNSNWKTDPAEQRQWVPGSSYSFHGYTYSYPQNGDGNTNLVISNSGLKIVVSQPNEYIESSMVDYMLSHSYKVADGSNYHIVMLYMEHAMSCVEVVVKKQMSDHQITLNYITLSNIFRSATMQCESQAVANSGESNVWITALEGLNNQGYTANSSNFSYYTNKNSDTLGTMSILAVPQQLNKETTLSVNYTVDENGNADGGTKEYTETFNLFNYVPFVWESGHKIKYILTINTGVELKAEISDWKEAGYTEGIILPPAQQGSGS